MNFYRYIYWTIIFSVFVARGVLAQTTTNSSGHVSAFEKHSDGKLSISAAGEKAATAENIPITGYGYTTRETKAVFVENGAYNSKIASYQKSAKENYVRVIKLANITFIPGPIDSQSRFASKILIGLNSPAYGFKNNLSVVGNFDLNVENIILGMTNSSKVTISYNLRRSLKGNDTNFALAVTKVFIQVGIPFGR